jgi:hypothetical protein
MTSAVPAPVRPVPIGRRRATHRRARVRVDASSTLPVRPGLIPHPSPGAVPARARPPCGRDRGVVSADHTERRPPGREPPSRRRRPGTTLGAGSKGRLAGSGFRLARGPPGPAAGRAQTLRPGRSPGRSWRADLHPSNPVTLFMLEGPILHDLWQFGRLNLPGRAVSGAVWPCGVMARALRDGVVPDLQTAPRQSRAGPRTGTSAAGGSRGGVVPAGSGPDGAGPFGRPGGPDPSRPPRAILR